MLVLGLDFESLGLDPTVHSICEVGAQLWDTNQHRAVMSMGYLVQVPEGTPFELEALTANNLTLELIKTHGKESIRGLKQLLYMYEQADVICAHNGTTFDRKFLSEWIYACELDFEDDKVWIDTMIDIEYPNKRWNKQLVCLAAYHGFLNPFPHQALSDVMTMLSILDRYPIGPAIASANSPAIGIKLLNLPYEDREWAKTHGFFPHRDKQSGKFLFWMKTIKEFKFGEELHEARESKYDLEKIPIPEGVY